MTKIIIETDKGTTMSNPMEILSCKLEQNQRDREILLAHDIMAAYPELTYGEALRHAYAKLRKEKEEQRT